MECSPKMSLNNQKTLVVLTPNTLFQIISILIKIWWLASILIALSSFRHNDSELDRLILVFLMPSMILLHSAYCWTLLNTLNTTVEIRADGLIMRGFFWKTYISWNAANQILLLYNQKARSHAVEIKTKRRPISWNNKISFDSSLHRKARLGVYHVLAFAQQHNIEIKIRGWKSYDSWKAWAKG